MYYLVPAKGRYTSLSEQYGNIAYIRSLAENEK